ncbi:hypothetical protein M0802_001488 [Mischocyttarus mexicanus]|nr:hypothetical protein M0802_001488 [Mischocyttarus mexicanus]
MLGSIYVEKQTPENGVSIQPISVDVSSENSIPVSGSSIGKETRKTSRKRTTESYEDEEWKRRIATTLGILWNDICSRVVPRSRQENPERITSRRIQEVELLVFCGWHIKISKWRESERNKIQVCFFGGPIQESNVAWVSFQRNKERKDRSTDPSDNNNKDEEVEVVVEVVVEVDG